MRSITWISLAGIVAFGCGGVAGPEAPPHAPAPGTAPAAPTPTSEHADPRAPHKLGELCGGYAGFMCMEGLECVDDPSDGCDPKRGGRDCAGVCQGPEAGPPAMPAGEACGKVTCPAGQVCCNASCGMCTPPGGVCTQQFCES